MSKVTGTTSKSKPHLRSFLVYKMSAASSLSPTRKNMSLWSAWQVGCQSGDGWLIPPIVSGKEQAQMGPKGELWCKGAPCDAEGAQKLDHCFPELVLLNLQLWIREHRDDGVAVPQWYKPYLEGKREAAKALLACHKGEDSRAYPIPLKAGIHLHPASPTGSSINKLVVN